MSIQRSGYEFSCHSIQVRFTESVQWMSLEFDPQTGFAQKEDIGELLIPRRNGLTSSTPSLGSKLATPLPPVVEVCYDDIHTDWDRYALELPPGLVLLPGQ